jgi:hypothetical protein
MQCFCCTIFGKKYLSKVVASPRRTVIGIFSIGYRNRVNADLNAHWGIAGIAEERYRQYRATTAFRC